MRIHDAFGSIIDLGPDYDNFLAAYHGGNFADPVWGGWKPVWGYWEASKDRLPRRPSAPVLADTGGGKYWLCRTSSSRDGLVLATASSKFREGTRDKK